MEAQARRGALSIDAYSEVAQPENEGTGSDNDSRILAFASNSRSDSDSDYVNNSSNQTNGISVTNDGQSQGLPDYRGSGRDADNVENQSDFDDPTSIRSESLDSTPEDQAEGIQSTDSFISCVTSDSQSDNDNTNDNQTNETTVTSDERVSGQTETRQTTSDDNSNDQNKSTKQ